jgi:type VI secretion system secreted protein VgrG
MDAFALHCAAFSVQPRVLAFRGDEELGQCFDYHVYFAVDVESSDEINPPAVLGAGATLAIATRSGHVRISGYVAEVELIEETAAEFVGLVGRMGAAVYRLRLVPSLWFLRHSIHSRVFVGQTLPEILRRILASAGLAAGTYDLRLAAAYAARDHVCQYAESDLDFLQRWMEREGIYYFFDHSHSPSRLVITDGPTDAPSYRESAVAYEPMLSQGKKVAHGIWDFREVGRAVPAQIVTSDYNYLTPDVAISATAPAAPDFSAQKCQWGEGETDVAGARRASRLRAERELCERTRYVAVGRPAGIHAGGLFSLNQHPVAPLNRSYLAVRTIHLGQRVELDASTAEILGLPDLVPDGGVYRVEIEAVASDCPFRPARRTHWPRVDGLELARVDGPADSEYAQLDDQGRYLVKLMLDENDAPAGHASVRVRQMQPHAGAPEGWHLPLRKGTEVLLAFLGGDPDRPVIAGAVPNANTPSPVTAANHTLNVVQTGGRTRIEIQDLAGSQYVDLSTPAEQTYLHLGAHAGLGDHNVVLSTAGDGLLRTSGNRDITVGGEMHDTVQSNVAETYQADQSMHVTGLYDKTIDSGATELVGASLTQTITGGLTQSISGGETRTVTGGRTETVFGSYTGTVSGPSTESFSADYTQSVGAGATITSSGAYNFSAEGGITLLTDGPMHVVTNYWLMNAPGGQVTVDDFFARVANLATEAYSILISLSVTNLIATLFNFEVAGSRVDFIGFKFEFEVYAVHAMTRKTEKWIVGGFLPNVGIGVVSGFVMFFG